MAELLYMGHASFRLTTKQGTVIYLDPYAGKGYDVPADYILVTHEHYDHNAVSLPKRKDTTEIWRSSDMLINGVYLTKMPADVKVTAVPACNRNHPIDKCVGYIIEADAKKLYFAGDTSYLPFMKEKLPSLHLDYAFLPCDGIFNMDAREATRCAEAIKALYSVPVHTKPGELFDERIAKEFTPENRLIIHPGETIRV